MQKVYMIVVGVVILSGIFANPVQAIPPFKKQFEAIYVQGNSSADFVDTVKKAKCFVCHDRKKDDEGKTSKKNRNAYGKELSKLLDKKADKKNVEKIKKALLQVAAMHSDPKDDTSPTFGELIESGKLPAQSSE